MIWWMKFDAKPSRKNKICLKMLLQNNRLEKMKCKGNAMTWNHTLTYFFPILPIEPSYYFSELPILPKHNIPFSADGNQNKLGRCQHQISKFTQTRFQVLLAQIPSSFFCIQNFPIYGYSKLLLFMENSLFSPNNITKSPQEITQIDKSDIYITMPRKINNIDALIPIKLSKCQHNNFCIFGQNELLLF